MSWVVTAVAVSSAALGYGVYSAEKAQSNAKKQAKKQEDQQMKLERENLNRKERDEKRAAELIKRNSFRQPAAGPSSPTMLGGAPGAMPPPQTGKTVLGS